VAFARYVFRQDHLAGFEQDLLSAGKLYFSHTAQRYYVLAAYGIMPVLHFPFGQAKKLSVRDLDRL